MNVFFSSTGTPENTYLFARTVEDRDGSEDEEAVCVKKLSEV